MATAFSRANTLLLATAALACAPLFPNAAAEDKPPINLPAAISEAQSETSLHRADAAPNAKRLTYSEAARYALSENPDLVGLRNQEESQRYHARQALAPNNPVVSVFRQDIPGLSPATTPGATQYQVAFTLGFPGKALSQSANSRHQAESLREQAAAKEIDILSALSNNYVALTANLKLEGLLNEEIRKAESLVKLLEKKYSAAQAAQADLLNARVVVAGLQHDLLENDNGYEAQLTQFRNLIKKPGATDYLPLVPDRILVPKLDYTLEQLTQLMLHNRHQLKSARRLVQASEAALTNATLQPFPDLQLTGGLNIYNTPSAEALPGVARTYMLGVGIAIPVFFPFNELSGIQAASRDRDASEEAEESARLQALADLQTAYTGFLSAQRSIDNSVKLVLPAAKASYDLTLTMYSLGKADYFVLNGARATWIQAEQDMIGRLVSSAQLYNQIVQQVGCDVTSKEGPNVCQ